MQLSNVRNNHQEQGFNLIEILVILAIVGILAAIGIPSLAAMHNRQKLNNAVEIVVATLREAQQRAIESHHSCQVTLDAQQDRILGNGTHSCIITGDRHLPTGIDLTFNGNDDTIAYGLHGNTIDNRTILLKIHNSKAPAQCVVISAPIGILRQGTYDPTQKLCNSNL